MVDSAFGPILPPSDNVRRGRFETCPYSRPRSPTTVIAMNVGTLITEKILARTSRLEYLMDDIPFIWDRVSKVREQGKRRIS